MDILVWVAFSLGERVLSACVSDTFLLCSIRRYGVEGEMSYLKRDRCSLCVPSRSYSRSPSSHYRLSFVVFLFFFKYGHIFSAPFEISILAMSSSSSSCEVRFSLARL